MFTRSHKERKRQVGARVLSFFKIEIELTKFSPNIFPSLIQKSLRREKQMEEM
jgi:hypothetical protein